MDPSLFGHFWEEHFLAWGYRCSTHGHQKRVHPLVDCASYGDPKTSFNARGARWSGPLNVGDQLTRSARPLPNEIARSNELFRKLREDRRSSKMPGTKITLRTRDGTTQCFKRGQTSFHPLPVRHSRCEQKRSLVRNDLFGTASRWPRNGLWPMAGWSPGAS